MNYVDNIGKNIRELRIGHGLSQEQLAAKCGFSNTTLSAYENSRKTPNLTTIAKIAKALEITIDRLYYGDENTSFIFSEPDIGKRVVNSVYFLWSEGIITCYEEIGYGYYPMIESNSIDSSESYLFIDKYYSQIKRLITSLNDFKQRKTTYADPDNYLRILLASVAKEINDEIVMEQKNAR